MDWGGDGGLDVVCEPRWTSVQHGVASCGSIGGARIRCGEEPPTAPKKSRWSYIDQFR